MSSGISPVAKRRPRLAVGGSPRIRFNQITRSCEAVAPPDTTGPPLRGYDERRALVTHGSRRGLHAATASRCIKSAVLVFAIIITNPLSAADLQVGVARANITPPLGGSMYGYGARGSNVSAGVHDPLFAKAIVLSDGSKKLAIVTLDLGSMPSENTANIRKLVQDATDIDTILLVASHTHSAPSFVPGFPDQESPYIGELESKIAEAIAAAGDKLQPAKIGVGWGRAEEGHNRRLVNADGTVTMMWGNRERKPTKPLDYAVGVIALNTPSGKPIATLVNFNCHPVVLGPENLQISADYPGAMMAMLEKEVGGQAMFVQGAAGDINPFWDKTDPQDGAFEQVTKMGETIAREVQRVRAGISSWESDVPLDLSSRKFEMKLRWDFDDPEAKKSADPDFARIMNYYLKGFENEKHAEVNTVLIGSEIALATFPGEFFVEHGLRLKQSSLVKNTFFVGYTNGALAYFPTIRAAAEGGYGATSATIVEVGSGERLVNEALIQIHRMAGKLRELPD
jgi:neutral ceramidase